MEVRAPNMLEELTEGLNQIGDLLGLEKGKHRS
jgi:hypothetical protein